MASEAGFEPAHGNSPPNRLATDPLKPLGYSDINRGSFLLYYTPYKKLLLLEPHSKYKTPFQTSLIIS